MRITPATLAWTAVCLASPYASNAQENLAEIKTIVVIYAENRSFDHLFGFFPGVNGIANASPEHKRQLDHDGTVLPYLTIFGPDGKPDSRFPRMPNEPFRIDTAPYSGVPDAGAGGGPIVSGLWSQRQIKTENRISGKPLVDYLTLHVNRLVSVLGNFLTATMLQRPHRDVLTPA
jgi:phospholipase C